MSSTHWDQCRAHVLQYADALVESIKVGKLNASACEGLIGSYLQQSAYSNVNRPKLLALALERIDGRPHD